MTNSILNRQRSPKVPNAGEGSLLLVDDDQDFREMTARNLKRLGFEVHQADCGETVFTMLDSHDFDVILLDVSMPGMNGIEVLKKLQETSADTAVVMLTGETTVKTVVDAMKLGAADYLGKPVSIEELVVVVNRSIATNRLKQENRRLKVLLNRAQNATFNMIGQSPQMQDVYRLIQRAGPTNKPILIQGESGTGKELVAAALHKASSLADKPMVIINCAALSENLLESELFGHERGAFTGATNAKEGLFELADGGTMFIDEIGEMSVELQAKMLRVLEDGSMRRVGSIKERRVKVRIITATNRNMQAEVDAGRFREDLFYRIDVMTLKVPPLRDREGDIELLTQHFIGDAGEDWAITADAFSAINAYSWPGNVRQLINAIERAKILSNDHVIELTNLPPAVSQSKPKVSDDTAAKKASSNLASHQRQHITQMLATNDGNKAKTARALGVSRRTLYRLLERHEIDDAPKP